MGIDNFSQAWATVVCEIADCRTCRVQKEPEVAFVGEYASDEKKFYRPQFSAGRNRQQVAGTTEPTIADTS
jgi:hypothetical protein